MAEEAEEKPKICDNCGIKIEGEGVKHGDKIFHSEECKEKHIKKEGPNVCEFC